MRANVGGGRWKSKEHMNNEGVSGDWRRRTLAGINISAQHLRNATLALAASGIVGDVRVETGIHACFWRHHCSQRLTAAFIRTACRAARAAAAHKHGAHRARAAGANVASWRVAAASSAGVATWIILSS